MVTKPNTSMPPNGEVPLKSMPKVEPPKAVAGFSFSGGPPATPEKEHKTFELPEKVSTDEIREQSTRYGGGRTAGGGTIGAPERVGRKS